MQVISTVYTIRRGVIKYLRSRSQDIINKALLSMAIIAYSRPFVKSSDGVEKGQSVLNVRLRDIYDDNRNCITQKNYIL